MQLASLLTFLMLLIYKFHVQIASDQAVDHCATIVLLRVIIFDVKGSRSCQLHDSEIRRLGLR